MVEEEINESQIYQINDVRNEQPIAAEEICPCIKCNRIFKNARGMMQHLRFCKAPANESDPNHQNRVDRIPTMEEIPERFYWGTSKGSQVESDIDECYEKIVFWRRNLFMLPNGSAGKNYIREMTRLLTSFNEDSPLKHITMKAIFIMPALLLQKPSKSSKSKDHVEALNRRLDLWSKGEFLKLLDESTTLQSRLPMSYGKKDLATISKQFKNQMQKGNVNNAIKIVTNNMSGGILPLNDETLALLRQKHPNASPKNEYNMLQGPIKEIPSVVYDEIDEELIIKAVKSTKGGSGPSGMDADGWRKPFLSKCYGDAGRDLRKAFAKTIKTLCTKDDKENTLEAFLACRLVPLDKRPGLRPIGVGEVLRRIAGKVIMFIAKKDVMESCPNIQMCSGHEAGCEAAIHAMKEVFEGEEAEAALLVDAANAFNSINRQAILHNIKIICPIMSRYVNNCYKHPARLFIIGGKEIKSNEGTTQGDPLGMAIYAIGLTPLIEAMVEYSYALANSDETKQTLMVAFADDLTAVGKFKYLRKWWDYLMEIGPNIGYLPQPKKSWLIVKNGDIVNAKQNFNGSNIQLTTKGERHLGAVIGDDEFRKEYCQTKVNNWIKEVSLMAEIATIEPQAVYSCYVSGYQSKYTYYIRTIPEMKDSLMPLEETIRHQLLPALLGGHIVNDDERMMLSLPPRFGGLGITIVHEIAEFEYNNSKKMTKSLTNKILMKDVPIIDEELTKSVIKNERLKHHEIKLKNLRSRMNDHEKRQNDLMRESGSYNWLVALPIKEVGYDLNKEQFWDALRIRYNWELPRLPSDCACGSKFSFSHALSCKKGGFVSMRHNELRDITALLLKEVCPDVKKEPMLLEISNEKFNERSANTRRESRLDVSALGFWVPGQRVFFDVRVFDPNAQRYRNTEIKKCYHKNEEEKKKAYNERVLQVENGTFTPLVFSATGGMGRECRMFFTRLSEMIAEKRNISVSSAMNFVRTKISFSLLRSALLCLRGSRTLRKVESIAEIDISLVNSAALIREV